MKNRLLSLIRLASSFVTPSARPMRSAMIFIAISATTVAVGCSDEASCVSLCEEAQEGDCTEVSGSCSSFCSALIDVEEPAGCSMERESYDNCLGAEARVCDTSCDAQERALTQCLLPYCFGNASDPNCRALVEALD